MCELYKLLCDGCVMHGLYTDQGINQLQAHYVQKYGPGDYVPPVAVTYWSFRLVVGAGVLMILLALYAVFLAIRRRFERARWFLWLLPFAIALPYLANATGWIMTEMGRQPWIVFGLLKTAQGVSPTVGAGTVLTSVILFTLLYGALAVVDVYLLAKYARSDGTEEAEQESEEQPSLAGVY